MGKIGDIWIRLGLKKDDLDKGLKDAEKSVEGFGGKFTSLKAIGVAAFAAIALKATQMAAEFLKNTQAIGDSWGRVTEGMKTAWNSFMQAAFSGDWEGLGNRIRNAFNAGRDAYNASDADFEVMNSIKIRKAAMAEELSLLQIQMRNQKLSNAERAQAAKDYLDKVRPLYQEEAKLRSNQRNAFVGQYLATAGLENTATGQDASKIFLTQVTNNGSLLNALQEYSKRNRGKSYQLTDADKKLAEDFLNQIEGPDKNYALSSALLTLADNYNGKSDQQIKAAVDAIVTEYSAAAAYDTETRRIQQMVNSMEASLTSGSVSSSGKDMPKIADSSKLDKTFARLDKAFNKETAKEVTSAVKDVVDELDDQEKELSKICERMEVDLYGLASPADWASSFGEYRDWIMEMAEVTEDASERIKEAIVSGISNALQTLADGIMGVEDISAKQVFGALLEPIAETCIQIGEAVMAMGFASEAFKKSLSNPYAAIAAGAALIAVGALAKSAISRSMSSIGGDTSSLSGSYGGSADYIGDTELHIVVDTYATGSTIESVVNSEKKKNSR